MESFLNNWTESLTVWIGAACTLGLYSILYRENKLYRFFEHLFLGVAMGYLVANIWNDTLQPKWWQPFHDKGQWWLIFVAVAGGFYYFIYSPKFSWLARLVIGFFLGVTSGRTFQAFANDYWPQIPTSFKPIIPHGNPAAELALLGCSIFIALPFVLFWLAGRMDQKLLHIAKWVSIVPTILSLCKVAQIARDSPMAKGGLAVPTALNNIVFMVILLSVMSYFFFSFEQKGAVLQKSAQWGRWLMMFAFGAIFGSTIMGRLALFIDRVDFLLNDFGPRLVPGGSKPYGPTVMFVVLLGLAGLVLYLAKRSKGEDEFSGP